MITLSVLAQANENTIKPVNEQQRLARHVQSLNELTERRRTNRLFSNEQSPLNGQRIHYTNVGKGNSSFIMRDLVLIHRLPIVFARVYDSSAGIGDFGKGWRLNYSESIKIKKNGDLLYFDESGSEHLLIKQNQKHYQAQYHFAQIDAVISTTKSQVKLIFNNGINKTFNLTGGQYKLSRISNSYGDHVELRYRNNKIQQISNPYGQSLTILRNKQGFITTITDHHNRQITFNYRNGLLDTSQDLAGNLWHYQYQLQQLNKVIDPEQNQVVKINYYQNGKYQHRTKNIKTSSQTYHFSYNGNITTVTNQLQLQTQFEQNPQGVTVAVNNSQNMLTRIALNDKLKVVKLLKNDLTIAEVIYDDKYQPITLIKAGKAKPLGYQYNQLNTIGNTHAAINSKGKPLSFSANGITRHYKYNHLGEVTEQREIGPSGHEILSTYLYDEHGLLEYLTVNNKQAHFEYNQFGQLEKINFPDQAYHQYQYNDLGLRKKTSRSDGSSINYNYDATGVLLNLNQNDDRGNHQLKEIVVDDNNLAIEYIVDGQVMLDIEYDETDNPTQISYNGQLVEYRYDQHNRLTTVIDGNNYLYYNYQNDESDIRIQQDQRSFISRLSKGRNSHNSLNINYLYTRTVGTPHQFIYFAPYLNQFKLPSFEQLIATDINHDASQRRRLYNAVSKQKLKQRDFDKPSNSLFIPPTYRGIHCELDFCWELIEVFLSGPTNTTAGQPVTFTATPVIGNMYDENNQCNLQHRFSIDGNIIEYNGSGILNYTFNSPGTREVEVRSNCQNCATWNFQYDSLNLAVENTCITPKANTKQNISSTQVNMEYTEDIIMPPATTDNKIWGSMFVYNESTMFNVDFEAVYNTQRNIWHPKINKAHSTYWAWWRLLPARTDIGKNQPVKEAIANLATKLNCSKMISDLKTLGSYYVDWYVLAAVEAHERTHITEWKSILDEKLPTIVSTLEAIEIPHTCGLTKAQAKEKLLEDEQFKTQLKDYKTDRLQEFVDIPDPNTATNAAELSKITPIIQAIKKRADSDWPVDCRI